MQQQYLKSEAIRNQPVRDARLKRLEILLQNKQADLSGEIDIDLVDLQDYKFIPGELFEVYNRKGDKIAVA